MTRIAFALALLAATGLMGCFDPYGGHPVSSRPEPVLAPTPAPAPAASAEVPRFWTWTKPMGAARNDPRIIELVRIRTHHDPERVADKVCQAITSRGLRPGEVAICLQNFGMGQGDPESKNVGAPALFKHWCDALPHPTRLLGGAGCERLGAAPVEKWWATTWTTHGVEECRAWMRSFIARYKLNQSRNPRIPDPSRFHFDSEGAVVPYQNGIVDAFHAMRDDPRWNTERLAGHGKTLAQLYAEGGSPPYAVDKKHPHEPNRPWSQWYAGVCKQAADGAMNEAAYTVIRAAWPGCKSSNYGTSDRYDGKDGRLGGIARDEDYEYAYNSFGDLKAPVCYWARPEVVGPDENIRQATIRRLVHKIDANIHSYGGPHDDVTPWILAVGHTGTIRNRKLTWTPEMMRATLLVLKDRGVDEILIWGDESDNAPVHWDQMVEIVDAVWGPARR